MKCKLKEIKNRFIGSEDAFGMESRVFHYVCMFSLIALGVNIPLNYLIGFPILTLVLFIISALVFISYYLSKWKKQYITGVYIYGLTCNLLFVLNFFFSSGTNGGSLMYFLLSFFLTMSVAPKQQYVFWISLNTILVGLLLLAELYYPDWVEDQFNDRETRYIDLSITYLIVIIMMAYITWEIRKNYYKEKKSVEKKAQELAKINEEKNKLFSVVAHDLRSPLASIQNYLEVMDEISFTEEEKKKISQNLRKNTEAVNEMIENLLTWVKSQLNGVKPNLKNLNVQETLKTTLELTKLLAQKKNVTLDIDIGENVSVTADTEMLQLIIRNLISNAIKFTIPGGFIKVSATNKDKICVFEITDNGIGITEQDQKDIFSHRLKSKAGTMNEKGSALGLIICRDYVDLQNGQIRLESKEGRGTTFYVTLPT